MKKKSDGVSTLQIAGTYIGTVVGAGFATGQEILQFFARFGIGGLWGILFSAAAFMLFGYIIMEAGYTLHARSHLEVLRYAGGGPLPRVMDIIVTFFLFGSVTAMLAGTGALFAQQFSLPGVAGSLLMGILTVLTVLSGTRGVISAISAIVPFLLVSVIGISTYAIKSSPPDLSWAAPSGGLTGGFVWAAVLYVSYNTVSSIAVLAPIGAHARGRAAIRRGALLGGLGLGVGAALIYLALRGNMAAISSVEVPMAYIAGRVSPMVQVLYAVVLLAEIYTTAVGSLYGFTVRVSDPERSPQRGAAVAIGVTAAAFFASLFGFSNLVKTLYPLVGYGGVALLAVLLWRWLSGAEHTDG